ncbi:MAG: DUF4097 domain-containing protein [Ruminococcaceae bacterium]|nr:DUF4097 domain-containing protein [Oscillospiraceae bacterium]
MKTKKIIQYSTFIVGGLLLCTILLGVLNGLIGKGEWNLGWTNYRYDDNAYQTGEGTIAAPNLERIDLDWIDGNVTVVICQDAYVSVSESAPAELSEKTQVHWFVSEDGKTLSIKYRGSSSFFGANKDKEKDLILRIPERLIGQLQTLNINAVSSNVTVSNIIIDNIDVKTVSGDVTIELPEATAFTLTHESRRDGTPTIDFPVTQEGNTYVSGIDGIKINVKTNSGKVAIMSIK